VLAVKGAPLVKTLPWRWPLLMLLAGMLDAAIPGSALAQLSSSD